MRSIVLAAFAALSLGFAIAPAANAASLVQNGSSVSDDSLSTRLNQTGVYSD